MTNFRIVSQIPISAFARQVEYFQARDKLRS